MKKLVLILFMMVSGYCLQAQTTIQDENAEKRTISGFRAIKIFNAFDVYITQGNEEAVAVSASKPEYREKIITSVEKGVLTIRFDDDKKFLRGWNRDRQKLKAYISVKKLEQLTVSGACDVYMEEELDADELIMNFSGASDLKGKINAKMLVVTLSGASNITLSGTAETAKIEASGASDFKGFDLLTSFCDAKASGASSVSITVQKELNASASGASSVHFKGEGLIRNIKTSGASSVTRKS